MGIGNILQSNVFCATFPLTETVHYKNRNVHGQKRNNNKKGNSEFEQRGNPFGIECEKSQTPAEIMWFLKMWKTRF